MNSGPSNIRVRDEAFCCPKFGAFQTEVDIGGNCGLYQFAFSTVTPPSLGTMLVRICGVVSTDYIKFACQYKNVFVPEY